MCPRRAGSIDTMLEVTIIFIVSKLDYKPQTRPIEPLQKGVVRVWSAYARPSWSTRINMAHSFIHKIL